MKIAVSSGKGGTGKTFIATNISSVLAKREKKVRYLDCDVEEPNGHLFLKPGIHKEEDVMLLAPCGVDEKKCIKCGKCVEACHYNAIAMVNNKVLFFNELCHVCGGCKIVCPVDAILEKERKIGVIRHGKSGTIDFHYALLETAEGGMSPRLVKKVKDCAKEGINILDSSPGTACPVVETVKEVDLCVLVTDPTPFGINDLKLAVDMARDVGQEPVIVVNRAEYCDNRLKDYCRREKLEIIGEIPDDRQIAETYSTGDIVVEKLPRYRELFEKIASRMIELAGEKRPVKKIEKVEAPAGEKTENLQKAKQYKTPEGVGKPEELVVISGKGGTGKTSLAASFAALAKDTVISDCDVDAADLHLILDPRIRERGDFSGGVKVEIDQDKCTGCGKCEEACQFSAIRKETVDGKTSFSVDPVACEGCGVCYLVCKDKAIKIEDAVNGEWFISETRFGPMSHAKLGVAEENSGRLVTLVRNKGALLAHEFGKDKDLIDGSPGTGCPVIASLTGADYALIVTEPTVSGIHDMRRVLEVTGHFGVPAGVVVNKYDLNTDMTDKVKRLSEDYNVEFLGVIPYDKKVTEAQMKGLSVMEYTRGPVTESIEQIWQKVSSRFKSVEKG
ncbi:MAG: cobyrinic acid ac-diamide synthase [Candidatus Makaraimicrobium thalassicum]|nr:MAG: cobyrinic acid ac-diamide synthase [Candidatus Omnitrophota bacterium]